MSLMTLRPDENNPSVHQTGLGDGVAVHAEGLGQQGLFINEKMSSRAPQGLLFIYF